MNISGHQQDPVADRAKLPNHEGIYSRCLPGAMTWGAKPPPERAHIQSSRRPPEDLRYGVAERESTFQANGDVFAPYSGSRLGGR